MSPLEAIDWRLALGSISPEEHKRLSACLPRPSSMPHPILDGMQNPEGKRLVNGNEIILSPDKMELHLQIYTIFREYVKHEDSLINWRLSWDFTIQGFLFAAYAVATQKVFEARLSLAATADQTVKAHLSPVIGAGVSAITDFVILLAVTGIAVTLLISFGVNAATLAIHELDERWRSVHTSHEVRLISEERWWHYRRYMPVEKHHGPIPPGLPGLVGGGIHRSFRGLGIAAKYLPLVFVAAWCWALVSWFAWCRVSVP